MKHKKYDIVSYINDKKKIIHAKIIDITDNKVSVELLKLWCVNIEIQDVYVLKTKNGHIVCKFEDDVKLVKDTRLEKLKRICDDNL